MRFGAGIDSDRDVFEWCEVCSEDMVATVGLRL